MSCHVGTPEKRVDHEMIAAGHPDLTFELDTFSAVMPRHWKFPSEGDPGGSAGVGNRQAVQLRESLSRLSRSAASKSCRNSRNWSATPAITTSRRHKTVGGKPAVMRKNPGAPAWDASRYVVFRHLVEQ